ncbi:dicarboxylate/amino acid:cation symporter [Novosphingobium beihaiensis]|uniref:Dicarboxylate/amino acid:cation symporter n=1 Tax=Novosphingobium beihaiensis TaxID=2930389 RepID=A0ABT0BVC0_9SPHN|nr:dicarboxylate/amino acid:cation symporter [Novosphingobium beihaiensis]MCJ2188996.1 dicarboxylate/amino acid:cation symporter [Novosphingobium beihaiensis]
MMRFWFRFALWKRVLLALVLGVAAGLAMGEHASEIKWIGDLFIRAIKMLVVPLIFFSLVSGITAVGDIGRLGKVGGRALALFMGTALIAVSLGMGLAALVQPGAGLTIALPAGSAVPSAPDQSLVAMIVGLVPENPIMAMAQGSILPVILFSVLFGMAILVSGDEGQPLARAMNAGSAVMQNMTIFVMELTPFGVFALIAWVTGTFGFDALVPLSKLVGLNYLGCVLILGIVYPLILRLIARLPVLDFYRGVIDAQAVAFSTASSNAALPVTLRCVERNLGVSNSIASFTVALGATINMNGTAMYLGVIALFGAQAYGIELSWLSYVMIALTSTLGAIGAAGVPGSGLVMMSLVLSSIGVPLETIAFVAGINHLLDMARTMTNVTGDATVAVAVGRMAGEIDVAEYVSADDV